MSMTRKEIDAAVDGIMSLRPKEAGKTGYEKKQNPVKESLLQRRRDIEFLRELKEIEEGKL